MKFFKFTCIILIIMIFLTPNVTAITSMDSKKAGITPDSKLWVLDKFLEKIELKITMSKIGKVQKRMKFAEERMVESKIMLGRNDIKSSLKALKSQEELITEARADTKQIKDYKDLTTATQAITMYKIKLEKQKEKVLETLPEGSPARGSVEMAFNKAIMSSNEIEENLNETMNERRNKIDSFLEDVSDETGIDVTGAYRNLMETGTVSNEVINEAVAYANKRIRSKEINLKSLEGRTIKINLLKDGMNTQTTTIVVMDGTIYGGNIGNIIEININIEDVPTYIEKFMEEDYDYLKQESIRKGGKDLMSILISIER